MIASFAFVRGVSFVLEDAPVCEQPRVIGPCEALIPRYHFNQATSQCERFNYGGCQGNQNNFETKEQCENACGRPSGKLLRNMTVPKYLIAVFNR